MASNSRPSSSICSGVSRARGLSISIIWGMRVLGRGSQGQLDGALGGVDARAHHLPGRAGDLAGAQVAHLAGAQAPDARVADPHAAAVGQRGAGLLPRDEDRRGAVAVRLDAARGQPDRAARAELRVARADDGLEALRVQARRFTLALPVLAERVEEVAVPAREGLAVAPVRAQAVEVGRRHAALLGRDLLVEAEAGPPRVQRA